MEIFRSVTAVVEPLSVDEAFLDVRGSLRRFSSPTQIAEHVRAKVADEQRITCSVGIATTTQLAKLASRRAKPDGLFVVARDQVTAFLHPMGVEELWGVGEKTAEQLHRLGLRTVVRPRAYPGRAAPASDGSGVRKASAPDGMGRRRSAASFRGGRSTNPSTAPEPTRPSVATSTTRS